jgi:hypothetical protein
MDTCNWLLDSGVDPDRIQWIRPRDPWLFNREVMQPLELVGGYMQMQARWVEACAEADDGMDFARRLEADGVFLRIDSDVEPEAFRGATVSAGELGGLRTIRRVVRAGRVLHIGSERITLRDAEVAADRRQVYVDCTAAGIRPTTPRPIFEDDRITLQYVTIGIVPWGAATVGTVERLRDDDADKNRLCRPVRFTGGIGEVLEIAHVGMTGIAARSAEPDLVAWNAGCRLDPARAAAQHASDPQVVAAINAIATSFGAAMHNLARRTEPVPLG